MSITTVSQADAEVVLTLCAEWLGKHGLGTPICPDGMPLTGLAGMQHPDESWCNDCTFGPAPTGRDASYHGIGPELVMDWDTGPAIVLEGGPSEWAIACSFDIQKTLDARGIKVFVEPYYSFVLSLYPN